MAEIFESAGTALLYGLVGFVVMAAGFIALDLVTPGKLFHVVWSERNRGAAVLLAGQTLAIGLVIEESIRASESEQGLGYGLVSTLLYGMAGVVVMTVISLVVGLLTPGRLGAAALEDNGGRPHPAAWVMAATYLGAAFMVGAAVS
ncbi:MULTISPECIES: DUF350 domain-containing protein [Streptomyces]|uniref:DUF350 domain-containing protein n=1 Tax=Streptomyces tsukubensis (strain DSM 42081 / NBRC 108919 / NRRL 18488 / 9993) TaxID=1114943 RepID=I2N8D5_STRT9|nr:DUF350 domain-containing protein [Streptomyces tsukubensis]MYS68201.1 DUF350 domain-containing protein [Streptomyces sp. SID5473]AZK97156.1 DUF350 domain-containing protein [Streptomyces tsukubensis]EIF93282.1 hypothetical protein [Streptomyces tsukubensis NRRL18488]QKM66876.1 DUF350 domain-containing protein [Streptomyces tsukubensis NRRL18488]TAI44777.1 DUF350 domain-containing protein [Streptomyces tsukubensis]